MNSLWFILAGLAIGGVSGLIGIGGGVLLIPILTLCFGLTQKEAQGTSLAALLPPVGLFAVLQYHRQGHVKFEMALWIAAGFAVGALGTSLLVQQLSNEALTRIFALMMLFVALRALFFSDNNAASLIFSALGTFLIWIGFEWSKRIGKRWVAVAKESPSHLDTMKDYQI